MGHMGKHGTWAGLWENESLSCGSLEGMPPKNPEKIEQNKNKRRAIKARPKNRGKIGEVF
jgi:hypothetical protein